jgi:hypothetical protein
MTTDTVVIQKAITSAFILDRPKFTRMLNIMEQRFSEAKIPFEPTFDVTLSKGRRISIASSDELLGLDNALKDPIITLGISAEGSSPEELSSSLSFDKFAKDNINIKVKAKDAKQGSQCFAELEEQVARTLVSGVMQTLKLGVFLTVIAGNNAGNLSH